MQWRWLVAHASSSFSPLFFFPINITSSSLGRPPTDRGTQRQNGQRRRRHQHRQGEEREGTCTPVRRSLTHSLTLIPTPLFCEPLTDSKQRLGEGEVYLLRLLSSRAFLPSLGATSVRPSSHRGFLWATDSLTLGQTRRTRMRERGSALRRRPSDGPWPSKRAGGRGGARGRAKTATTAAAAKDRLLYNSSRFRHRRRCRRRRRRYYSSLE